MYLKLYNFSPGIPAALGKVMRAALFAILTTTAIVSGCAVSASNDGASSDDAFTGSGAGDYDTVSGIPGDFDHNRVMDDSFYEASNWATTEEIQSFLEKTVWGKASWLATQKMALINDDSHTEIPLSEAITTTAKAHHINPVLILARMQVEKGIVSPSAEPASSSFALGCHKVTAAHPNGLDPSAAGLDYQLECGATTLETQINNAREGKNNWSVGQAATTQDGVRVDPSTNATSALYAYTPVEGSKAHNGNWLVWNLTHRFAVAIQSAR